MVSTENVKPPVPLANADEQQKRETDLNRDVLDKVAQCAAVGEISDYAVTIEGEERTTWFVWLLVCCCTISGLLFGGFKTRGGVQYSLMRFYVLRL